MQTARAGPETRYFLQQSPLQKDEPCWQQFEVQQELAQHFAFGLQQESPVIARAESEDRVRTRTANIFFMEISSRCEWVECLRRSALTGKQTHRELETEVFFEVEYRKPVHRRCARRKNEFSLDSRCRMMPRRARVQRSSFPNCRDEFRVDARCGTALRMRAPHAAARDRAARHLSAAGSLHRRDVFGKCGSRSECGAECKYQNHAQTKMALGLHDTDSSCGEWGSV